MKFFMFALFLCCLLIRSGIIHAELSESNVDGTLKVMSVTGNIQIIQIPSSIDSLPIPTDFPRVSKDSQYNSICGKYNISKSMLWMDVQWVLQGYEIGFQGFFVEFLGYAESFMNLIPLGRLVKSSFRKSFDEIPVRNYDQFVNHDLFPKEKNLISWLLLKYYPNISTEDLLLYGNQIKPLFPLLEITQNESCYNEDYKKSVWEANTDFHVKNELSRSTVLVHKRESEVTGASSMLPISRPEDCCALCLAEKLCTQWSFSESKCRLSNSLISKTNYTSSTPPVAFSSSPSSSPTRHNTIMGKISLITPPSPEQQPPSPSLPSTTTIRYRTPKPRALIFHGTTCIHENTTATFTRDINTIYIGRYMLERSRFTKGLTLDEYAVSYCSGLMDEIWVPTKWHQEVFEKFLSMQGINKPSITIIPEAVDTSLFLPSYYQLSSSSSSKDDQYVSDEYRPFHDHRTVKKNCHFISSSDDIDGSLHSPPRKLVCDDLNEKFEFLSIFKWEYRKGWDILLQSYWSTFQKDDQVILRVRTYLPNSEHGDRNITRQMESYAEKWFQKPLSELPPVVWENGQTKKDPLTGLETIDSSTSLTREQMKELLETADAFVLPTRGEGWGLPIAEAMSMELPVLVTNATGILAYGNDRNAYLIGVESTLDDLSFVIPKKDDLSFLFTQVIEDYQERNGFEAIKKGQEARFTMKEFNSDMIVCKMNERLRYHAERRGWIF
jgi:glycosyltransferase involved in cell wall biosynthesis